MEVLERPQATPRLLLQIAPGLLELEAQLRAAFERRLAAAAIPEPAATIRPFVHDEAEALAIDMAMHRWKMSGGPARDNEERALALQEGRYHSWLNKRYGRRSAA